MRTSVKCFYLDFLERLSCCVEHVDWNKDRTVKMEKVLANLGYNGRLNADELQKYHNQLERAIDCFEKEQIEDYELVQEIKRLINEIN